MNTGDEIKKLKMIEEAGHSSGGLHRHPHILYLLQGTGQTSTVKTGKQALTLVWSVDYRGDHPPDAA